MDTRAKHFVNEDFGELARKIDRQFSRLTTEGEKLWETFPDNSITLLFLFYGADHPDKADIDDICFMLIEQSKTNFLLAAAFVYWYAAGTTGRELRKVAFFLAKFLFWRQDKEDKLELAREISRILLTTSESTHVASLIQNIDELGMSVLTEETEEKTLMNEDPSAKEWFLPFEMGVSGSLLTFGLYKRRKIDKESNKCLDILSDRLRKDLAARKGGKIEEQLLKDELIQTAFEMIEFDGVNVGHLRKQFQTSYE